MSNKDIDINVVAKRCSDRIEKSMLSWLGHIVRIDEKKCTKQIYMENVSGPGGRRRPRRTLRGLIGDVLERDQGKSIRNR